MNKKKKQKIIRYSIIGVVLVVILSVVLVAYGNRTVRALQYHQDNSDLMEFNPFVENENRLDNSLLEYGKVLTKYGDRYAFYTGEDIRKNGSDYDSFSGGEVGPFTGLSEEILDETGKETIPVVFDPDDSCVSLSADRTTLTYTFQVPKTALYSLQLEYLLPSGKNSDVLVGFTTNGKLPFAESTNMNLTRKYSFYGAGELDIGGNEVRAKQQEIFEWQTQVMTNPTGLYRNPYRFVLQEGENTITLTFSREASIIKSVSLVAPMDNMSYEEYLSANHFQDADVYTGEAQKFELEVPTFKNDMGLLMAYDFNYASSPAAYDTIRYNVFGGDRWNEGGMAATWTFTVPQTGWYQLSFRYSTPLTYVSCYREVKIDGVIPFAEMEEYCFPYSDGWVCEPLKDAEQNPYLFYLTAGESHTITLTSKVGPLRHSMVRMEECMDSISELIRKVVQLTASQRTTSGGYAVDKNRDWDLQLYIPNIQEDIEEYAASFKAIYDEMEQSNGGKIPYYGSAVLVAKTLFDNLAKDLENVPASLNEINNALSGLSNTYVSIKDQPLTVDYMYAAARNASFPDARSNAWQNMYVGIRQFYWSFVKDYSAVGQRENSQEGMKEITVYVARGREQVDILRNMISETFTPETGIKVNVVMISGGVEGVLMLRYVAGTAPDVAISIGKDTPVQYAMRGALLNLNQFDGFEKLWKSSYLDGAFTPYLYRGDYYAFPETQDWSALFYRTDILEDLGLEVPNTWDDVYKMLPVLQEEGYDFSYAYNVAGYLPFLYQHGGDLYDINGLTSALNTNAAYNSFTEYADLYIKYNIPYAANFYMRFKTGDLPIGIGNLAFYSQLSYAAPELNGKWSMAPVPGHLEEDGVTVNRSYPGAGTCAVILSSTKYPQESWKFLEWWLSDDVQAQYGQENEALYGVASRWNPANINAVQTLPYSEEELNVINAQWEWFMESPNVLGGYYTTRYLLTALNETVLQGENARTALEDAILEINKEMLRKQKEFNIVGEGASVLWETAK